MLAPPSDEGREILQPSLLPIPDNSGPGVKTTSDHYCVSNGVRDGTGRAVINNVTDTNIIITSLHVTLTLLHILAGSLAPGYRYSVSK